MTSTGHKTSVNKCHISLLVVSTTVTPVSSHCNEVLVHHNINYNTTDIIIIIFTDLTKFFISASCEKLQILLVD